LLELVLAVCWLKFDCDELLTDGVSLALLDRSMALSSRKFCECFACGKTSVVELFTSVPDDGLRLCCCCCCCCCCIAPFFAKSCATCDPIVLLELEALCGSLSIVTGNAAASDVTDLPDDAIPSWEDRFRRRKPVVQERGLNSSFGSIELSVRYASNSFWITTLCGGCDIPCLTS